MSGIIALRCRSSAFLLALACLMAAPASAQTLGTPFDVSGRLLHPATGESITCCLVTATVTGVFGVTSQGSARTDSDGRFRIQLRCDPTQGQTLQVVPTCCDTQPAPLDITGCTDPATGGPLEHVDLGDFTCQSVLQQATNLSGRLLCRHGSLLEGVVDCSVLVEDDANRWSGVARTDGSGEWELCLPCPQPNPVRVVRVTPQCCGDSFVVTLQGCDPSFPTGTRVCTTCPQPPCPVPGEIVVRGQAWCAAAMPHLPLADCAVRVRSTGCGGTALRETQTNADGSWSLCLPCPAGVDCGAWSISAELLCCPNARQDVSVLGCPAEVLVPDLNCFVSSPVCPSVTPGCGPNEKLIEGYVTCGQPGLPPRAVEDCMVLLSFSGCNTPTVFVQTNANGYYSFCHPCQSCVQVSAVARCCTVQTVADYGSCSQPLRLDLHCPDCVPACTPNFTQVFGLVSCTDASMGADVPVPGCVVTLSCPGGTPGPITAVTGPDGVYRACVPCSNCTGLVVSSGCCDAEVQVPVMGCPTELRVDLDCMDCPGTGSRPCENPEGTLAQGSLTCDGPGGARVPIAGCEILLISVDGLGREFDSVVTETDGRGRFADCVACPPNGLGAVRAVAQCCDVETELASMGCPEELSLPELACEDCDHCPPGMTRYQGRVRCRRGGDVPNCDVVLTLPTCAGGDLTYIVRTDARGRWRLCAPCACEHERIRISALCCDAVRTVRARHCSRSQPLPTLTCDSNQCRP